jgi:CHAD domain-containing protein
VLLERLRTQTGVLLGFDAGVRCDEPDSVHQMRVAVRRMRSALKTYPGVLDPSRADMLAEELKWLGGVLGVARDSEVVKALLDARAEALPGEPEYLDAFFSDDYRTAWRDAVKQLESDRYYRLLDALDAAVNAPVWGAKARDKARGALRKAARRQRGRTARRIEAAYAADPGPDRDLAWHEARKAAKRARYAGETAGPSQGGAAARFARLMKQVQQTLGARQDTVITRHALTPLAQRAADQGRDTFGYATLYADLLTEAAEHEDRLGAVWDRAAAAALPGGS